MRSCLQKHLSLHHVRCYHLYSSQTRGFFMIKNKSVKRILNSIGPSTDP